jgi:superfamily II DNA or RNA helicase/HKD family nuclease
MTRPVEKLPPGLYEALVTEHLKDRIEATGSSASRSHAVDPADGYELLARHVFEALRRHLRGFKQEERAARQAEFVNRLLAHLGEQGLDVVIPPSVLEAVVGASGIAGEEPRLPERPRVPLSQSDLLVNARGEPGVGQALATEIASADEISLLCAFVRWHGLRVLLPALQGHRAHNRRLRVITTTYTGSTERRALDELARLGAEVRISYETQSTRLHAKAWLLHRRSGFSTAFIGSSNLSKSALVDGIEWNVRLSSVVNPDVIEKFAATFESYWEDPSFELYSPDRDGGRLDQELRRAGRGGSPDDRDVLTTAIALLDVHPHPHQREILERLATARVRHNHHRNLVVAATGTGKTVVAALDYRGLCEQAQRERPGSGQPSLLFVAHRKEILEQSLFTFRNVLRDTNFGELYVDGHRPDEWQHVFASVQSLAQLGDEIRPEHFQVVIIDEFHHAAAPTYENLLRHLSPRELLGLTATPERADGKSILEWFDGRIAAEIRLWEALDRQLLCPFHYFGVHDGLDLSRVSWRRGGYETSELSNVFTGDDMRVRLVLQQLRDRVGNVGAMRALGFCVSVAHAEFMARRFNDAGVAACAVSADSSREEREDALRALRERRVNVVFAVDLFNEGVDVPEIDTVLFLRPTESATVFLQQLGRGLRHAGWAGKSCLTVLDFIGQAHRQFRFDRRFRALTGTTRAALRAALEDGFPHLPAGCSIQLDRVARDMVLANVRAAIGATRASLVEELRSLGRDVSLPEYLREADLDLDDVYRLPDCTWTRLRREAGLPTAEAGGTKSVIEGQLGGVLHWDDPERLSCYLGWIQRPTAPRVSVLSERERRLAVALVFSLLGGGRKWKNLQTPLDQIWEHRDYLDEIRQLLPLLEDRAQHLAEPLDRVIPDWKHPVPLSLHSRYSQAEILTAFDLMTLEQPYPIQAGVKYDAETRTDLFFVTLEKSEQHYSPTTLYKDYAISPSRFHWESQNTTATASPTGQRYIHHATRGSHVLLFVRTRIKEGGRTLPYSFLGPATYESHSGERPMGIIWRLAREIPADLYAEARLAAG